MATRFELLMQGEMLRPSRLLIADPRSALLTYTAQAAEVTPAPLATLHYRPEKPIKLLLLLFEQVDKLNPPRLRP